VFDKNEIEKLPESPAVFTIEKANRSLPLVRLIVKDIVEISERVRETRRRLAYLGNIQRGHSFTTYQEEVDSIEKGLKEDEDRIAECILELNSLGVEVKEIEEGLVEFPALKRRELVFLSWKFGEPEIEHWHTRNADSDDRLPIAELLVDLLESDESEIDGTNN